MKNHPYTITFPIWKCPQWSALRGRLKLTDESIVVARFTDTQFLDEEIDFLQQQARIKPKIEGKFIDKATNLLPSVLQIIRTNTYTDLVLDNCSQWQLTNGDLSKLLLIWKAYDIYEGASPRDCTLENVMRNGDSIVVLDFGLRKRTEKYCVYWNPLILKGKPYMTSLQWSLGVMFLVMTQGSFILNQIHKLIADWLKGARLDVQSLIVSKKPAVCQLIASLLNIENPIPWEMIPHHSAFRDDAACRVVLKEYQIESQISRLRSSSRMSSRGGTSPLTIMPNPNGRRSSFVTESVTVNQSLITKVSNIYKQHQDKVRVGVNQNNNKTTLKFSKQFTNFFTTTKLAPKFQKTQGPKSFRNFAQNTSNTQREQDLTQYRVLSKRNSQEYEQIRSNSQMALRSTEGERLRSRAGSIKMTYSSATNARKYSTNSIEKQEVSSKQQPNDQEAGYDSEEENSPRRNNSSQQEQQQSQQQQQQLQQQQQQQLQVPQLVHSESDHYIQLIKKPTAQIKHFLTEYNRGLDSINIIGQAVAKCLEFLNGLHNFWVVPLFLVFKRMLQLRIRVETTLVNYENVLKVEEWDQVCESRDFLEFLAKVKSDNFLVQNEMNLLLKAAVIKAEKLDQSRKEKVEWFLNDDMNQNITEVCHTYLVGQIYKSVKERKGIQKPYIDWVKLAVQVQASIIIINLPCLQCDIGRFSFEGYQEAMTLDDIQQIGIYLSQNDQYLEYQQQQC